MMIIDNSTAPWERRFTPSTPVERISRTSHIGIILPALPKKKNEQVQPAISFQELFNKALEKESGNKA